MDTFRSDRGNGGVVLTALATRTDDNRLGASRTIRKKEKELRLVEVSWIDAYTESSWAEYKPETTPTKTYGILVRKTRDWTTLAMTKEKDYWGNLWHIPTKNVLEVKELLTIPSAS